MIEIGSLIVKSFVLDELTISWEVEIDPEEDILDYEMSVLRSESPEGDFETVASGLFDVYSFIDTTVSTRSKWRKFYYKVEALHIMTSATASSEASSSYLPTELNLIGLEIARREKLLLREFVGVPCTLLIMRRWGAYCPDCWDVKKKQVTISNCTTCYRVGRDKGYYTPIENIFFQISPHGQSVDHANIGTMEPAQTNAWTSNYPLLTPGDVIIEPGNKRWRISAVSTTEQFRIPVRQMVQLHYINPNDIEYRITI